MFEPRSGVSQEAPGQGERMMRRTVWWGNYLRKDQFPRRVVLNLGLPCDLPKSFSKYGCLSSVLSSFDGIGLGCDLGIRALKS